ncbi:MAG: class I SAM-dependent methyltransferase [Acidimicrobiales bacterium]
MLHMTANQEMARAWDGEEGDRWTEQAQHYEAAGTRHWRLVREGGFVTPGDRVLDVGCGTGSSTRDLARLAAPGSVLGVDLSARMLAYARERTRAEGLENAAYLRADAQVHPFDQGRFDVITSSFGAMFFDDQPAAFANLAAALRPGGRMALLAWRELGRNEWLTALREALAAGRDLPEPPAGAPGPFGLADADRVSEVLAVAGFADVAFTPVDEPVFLGADAADAWSFVRTMGIVKGLTQDLDPATVAEVLEGVQRLLAEHETPDGVQFASSAWLITARTP